MPGVGKTSVQGAAARAVRVWLDPTRLAGYGLSPEAVATSIRAANVNLAAGSVVSQGREHPIRVAAALTDAGEVGNVVVDARNDRPVFLRDVATVTAGPAADDVRSFFAFGPATAEASQRAGVAESAVTIAIARQKGTNGVEVADAVLTKLQSVEREALPQGVTLAVTRNDGATADDAVNTLIEHLTISIAAVVAILLVFLGWREASVVALSIPLILFIVLGVGWVAGQTINRITLFALILSLGLLVDDSIVVIENVHRHLHHERQRNFSRLMVAAANEIGKPTIVATFTVILALIPMAFVTGMMGPFMQPIPFNAPIAMLASLFIAYTVVRFALCCIPSACVEARRAVPSTLQSSPLWPGPCLVDDRHYEGRPRRPQIARARRWPERVCRISLRRRHGLPHRLSCRTLWLAAGALLPWNRLCCPGVHPIPVARSGHAPPRDMGYAIGALAAGIITDLFGAAWAIATIGVLTFISGALVAIVMRERVRL